jgi:hypothetical protein
MAITREQFKAANARGAAALERGPIARAARYDSRRGLIVITLKGGCEFAFPIALAEGLADAPRSKLAKITVSPNGLGLHWPLLDADLFVPGLIEGAFGSRRWMQQIGSVVRVAVPARQRQHVRMANAADVRGRSPRHEHLKAGFWPRI